MPPDVYFGYARGPVMMRHIRSLELFINLKQGDNRNDRNKAHKKEK